METDWRGYAVVCGHMPYDLNRMNIDKFSLPGNVEVERSSKNTEPTRGRTDRG